MDNDGVIKAALDYFEGWYEGDVARMERALHPELAKRGFGTGIRDGRSLVPTTTGRMLELTAAGEGREDGSDPTLEVVVEDVHDRVASVTVRSAVYREYLHLVETAEGWKIVNTLYGLS
jgi:hypothetical protein